MSIRISELPGKTFLNVETSVFHLVVSSKRSVFHLVLEYWHIGFAFGCHLKRIWLNGKKIGFAFGCHRFRIWFFRVYLFDIIDLSMYINNYINNYKKLNSSRMTPWGVISLNWNKISDYWIYPKVIKKLSMI